MPPVDFQTTAIVNAGKLFLDDKPGFLTALARCRDGQGIVLRLSSIHQRSNQSNRYYWSTVIATTAAKLKYSPSEMHDGWRLKFLSITRQPLPTVRSTAGLLSHEFSQYLDEIRAAAADLGVDIPEAAR